MGTLHRTDVASYASAWTSPATPGTPRCSNIASYIGDSSVLGHRHLHRGLLGARTSPATPGTPRCSDIASYAGDYSVLGHRQLRRELLGAQTSPATLATPRCLDSSCKSHQLSWGLPWWSDLAMSHRCAIKLLHTIQIRVLILGSMFGVLIRACQTMLASF